jgi:ferredoxin
MVQIIQRFGDIQGKIMVRQKWSKSPTNHQPLTKGVFMPKLTVENFGAFDVPAGKRLVLALVDEAGVDQLHACGGNCRCTTCRVEFVEGEPEKMTEAEKNKLAERGLSGVRLSCQIECEHDMTVRAISRLEDSGRPDPGSRPDDQIQPEPVWTKK